MHIKEVSVTLDICSYLEAGDRPATLILAASSTQSTGTMLGTTEARLSLCTLQMRILEACQGLDFVLREEEETETNTWVDKQKLLFHDER